MFMKKLFRGKRLNSIPDSWDILTSDNVWINSKLLKSAEMNEKPFSIITHQKYCCCEYTQSLNLFSFGKLKLKIPFTVIAPPISVDKCGYSGDIDELIEDFKTRKGLFLILNISPAQKLPKSAIVGLTLSSAIFLNKYKTFTEYMNSLRSNYRRRLKIAMQKGKPLDWVEIANTDFDEKLYKLYFDVLKKSKYPLETLSMEFFKSIEGQIHVLIEKNEPVAFILIKPANDSMHFLIGGMSYEKRDRYDLYYNMLLKILQVGIENNAKIINFGQTAESSKCRIGCQLEDRYMAFFSGNSVINLLARITKRFLEYTPPAEKFRTDKNWGGKEDSYPV